MVMLNGLALMRTVMIRLETGRQPSVHCIFVNEESNPVFMLVILPTVVELMSSISRCFPLVLPSCSNDTFPSHVPVLPSFPLHVMS